MIRAIELTARLGIRDRDRAYRWWGFGAEGDVVSEVDWDALGLPSSLRLEGRSLAEDVYAAGERIDWGLEPEPGDFLAGDAEGLPHSHEVPTELRARGARLAERVACESPTLWVLDPQRKWHLGPAAPEWSLPLPESMDQWIQLDLPGSPDCDWPWRYVPEYAGGGGRWAVPLPKDLDWDDRIVEATEHYCRAVASAHGPRKLERALGLGLQAMQAMNRAIGWMGDEFRVRDFTGRSPITDVSTVTWPKGRARALREDLRTFTADVPGPPLPTGGMWVADGWIAP
jgi:hypothetical protein